MPATTPWYQGAQVPLTFLLTDTLDNPQSAALLSSVTCTVTAPDGTASTPAVSTGMTGTYTAAFTSVQAGHHVVSWVCTDAAYPGAFGDTFEVQVLPDPTIVSLAEAKEILHLTTTTEFDSIIQGYNAAVTDWIDYTCGPVVQRTVVERLPSRGDMQALSKPPVLALLAWTTFPPGMAGLGMPVPVPPSPMFPTLKAGFTYELTELYADPKTGIVTHTSRLPFILGPYIWQYSAGRLVIPGGIYEAAKITLEHLFMVERGGADTAMTAGEDQTVLPGFGFAVPNRALTLLQPHSAASRMVAV